jgi:hypothetical protein
VVSGRLVGPAPGDHGLHLHTTGRCDPPTFESAGSHWNPTSRQRGTQSAQGPHLGDLPNVRQFDRAVFLCSSTASGMPAISGSQNDNKRYVSTTTTLVDVGTPSAL